MKNRKKIEEVEAIEQILGRKVLGLTIGSPKRFIVWHKRDSP